MKFLVFLFGSGLFLSALSLVTAQYQARSLFVTLERESQIERQLEDENKRLKVELNKVSQPEQVTRKATKLGLHPTDGNTTKFIEVGGANAK